MSGSPPRSGVRPAPAAAPYGPHPDPRLAAVLADVRARLQRACAAMAPDAFEALVHTIAARKLRWAVREEEERAAERAAARGADGLTDGR